MSLALMRPDGSLSLHSIRLEIGHLRHWRTRTLPLSFSFSFFPPRPGAVSSIFYYSWIFRNVGWPSSLSFRRLYHSCHRHHCQHLYYCDFIVFIVNYSPPRPRPHSPALSPFPYPLPSPSLTWFGSLIIHRKEYVSTSITGLTTTTSPCPALPAAFLPPTPPAPPRLSALARSSTTHSLLFEHLCSLLHGLSSGAKYFNIHF